MTNELISNPSSKMDDICNYIIWLSNEFAKSIGLSYSELWIIIPYFYIQPFMDPYLGVTHAAKPDRIILGLKKGNKIC